MYKHNHIIFICLAKRIANFFENVSFWRLHHQSGCWYDHRYSTSSGLFRNAYQMVGIVIRIPQWSHMVVGWQYLLPPRIFRSHCFFALPACSLLRLARASVCMTLLERSKLPIPLNILPSFFCHGTKAIRTMALPTALVNIAVGVLAAAFSGGFTVYKIHLYIDPSLYLHCPFSPSQKLTLHLCLARRNRWLAFSICIGKMGWFFWILTPRTLSFHSPS